MSLYVVSTNQELLWNVISKNSYIQTFFSQYNPDRKIEWFKTIISNIYEKYKNRNLTVTELNSINKETISYMIQNVREQTNSISAPTSPNNNNPDIQSVNSYTINTPPIIKNNQQDIYANQFEQRQKEYELMNKRKIPDSVDFTEKLDDDGVIENMDTLVQQQLKQREYDMNNIPPPANIVSQQNQTNISNNVVERPKLNIDTDSNINISIQELDQHNKKSVSWKDEQDNVFTLLKENIESITQNLNQLTQTVSILQDDMKLLQKTHGDLHTQIVHNESKATLNNMLDKIEILQ